MTICKFTVSGNLLWKGAVIVDDHNLLEKFGFAGDSFEHDVPPGLPWFTFWAKGNEGEKISVEISRGAGKQKVIITRRNYTMPTSLSITRDIQFDPDFNPNNVI